MVAMTKPAAENFRMKLPPIGFSSIGLPGSSLDEIFAVATAFRCDFTEIRVLTDGEDLRRYLDAHGTPPVPIRVLGTSLSLRDAGPDDLRNFAGLAGLAHRSGTPFIRVFFGGEWTIASLPEEQFQAAVATIRRCREVIGSGGFATEILLETHCGCSSSERCLRLIDLLGEPLPILWDSHNTWRLAGEPPSETWRQLRAFVRHVHCKDSITDPAEKSGYRYVPPGDGEFPLGDLLSALAEGGYQGGISLEWEKMWHPDLPPFTQAFEKFLHALAVQGN
jgi:sugar phosphate isomerase/epimerase